MTLYEKLNAARLRFLQSGAKKSGYNAFAKYHYFELSDILPVINRAAQDYGFTCVVSFGKEEATLDFVDAQKPEERISFSMPMATAELKGCHPVQSMGAAQTYIRRYLYTTAFEIVECDAIDSLPQTAEQPSPSPANGEAKGGGKGAGEQKAEEEPKLDAGQMRAKIECILTATLSDGKPAFTAEEKQNWWKRFKKNPVSVIYLANAELEKRQQAQAQAQASQDEFVDDIPF